MVVGSGGGSFEALVASEFDFLACFTAFLGYEFGHGLSVEYESVELFEALDTVCHGGVEQACCQCHKAGVLSHEVSFAAESHDSGEVAIVFGQHAAFGSLAVFTLCSDGFAFLAKDFNSGVHVAVGFGQSFFAVHYAGACEVAQLSDFCHCNCHMMLLVSRE